MEIASSLRRRTVMDPVAQVVTAVTEGMDMEVVMVAMEIREDLVLATLAITTVSEMKKINPDNFFTNSSFSSVKCCC